MSDFDLNPRSQPAASTRLAIQGFFLQAGYHNPSVNGQSAQRGTIYIEIAGPGSPIIGAWQKLDDHFSTNWIPFGTGGGFSMVVQDETNPVKTNPTFMNFTGAGVTASLNGTGVDVTIPGGGGAATWYLDPFTLPPASLGVTLSQAAPIANSVIVALEGAGPLLSGIDFTIVGNAITWSIALAALIAAGGKRVVVNYQA